MNISELGTTSDGARSVEIRCAELPFPALIRCLKAIPGANVREVKQNPMSDDASAKVDFKGCVFEIETPMSDYLIVSRDRHDPEIWKELLSHLRNYKVRWWERFLF